MAKAAKNNKKKKSNDSKTNIPDIKTFAETTINGKSMKEKM